MGPWDHGTRLGLASFAQMRRTPAMRANFKKQGDQRGLRPTLFISVSRYTWDLQKDKLYKRAKELNQEEMLGCFILPISDLQFSYQPCRLLTHGAKMLS